MSEDFENSAPATKLSAEQVVQKAAAGGADPRPVSLALEIHRLLHLGIDKGTLDAFGFGKHGSVMSFSINGDRFTVSVHISAEQLVREGVPPAELGIPEEIAAQMRAAAPAPKLEPEVRRFDA